MSAVVSSSELLVGFHWNMVSGSGLFVMHIFFLSLPFMKLKS